MATATQQWGRRLSDSLRTALARGDLAGATRLLLEGDGQTRDLAREYTFMVRGLAITVRVLIELLGETASRAPAAQRDSASAQLAALLQRLRVDLAAVTAEAPVNLADGAPADGAARPGADQPRRALGEEQALTVQALAPMQVRFDAWHARLAGETVAAIDARDVDRALALIDAKEQTAWLPLHDRLVRFMAESFAWVLQQFGADELLQFHLATAAGQRAGFDQWERMPAAEFARASAFLLKQHMGEVAVREDDEKFTIAQTPCGSGGRLQSAGAYAGSDALPMVETAGPLTFGLPRLPIYCSHCAIWNGLATLRWFGRAHWVFEQPARADGGCTLHIYKRHDGTPRDYAARLGVVVGATRADCTGATVTRSGDDDPERT